ncbi:hypothetical protein BJY00DRAFT_307016 [Aspergillus carlsbadensis]|nr:hypothetical protein BJY00DRAFT_307016 [Aspergillus carlsbadensis]
MSSNTSCQASGVKGSQSNSEALTFIPWAIDQLDEADSSSTQDSDEISSTSLVPRSPGSLQMDPVSLMSLSQIFHILPIPEDSDDLETTVEKVSRLAHVVDQGNSLALWTGMKLASETLQDAESIAKAQMPNEERRIYEAWKEWATTRNDDDSTSTPTTTAVAGNASTTNEGTSASHKWFRLPDFNWEQNVAPVPEGAQSSKRFTQRAAAMDIVFGHQGTTPENAAWLTFNMASLLPLVKAVTKISNMERHYRENRSKNTSLQGLKEMEIAEMETARRVVAAAERNLNREAERTILTLRLRDDIG